MAGLVPEFISVLRDIRDRMYPKMNVWYDDMIVVYSDVKVIEKNIEFMQEYLDNLKVEMEGIRDSIHAISIGSVTTIDNLPDGEFGQATANYNGLNSTLDLGIPAGASATADAGATITLAAGEDAEVTNLGTTRNAVFEFKIPQGIQGVQGIQGIQGIQGSAGQDYNIDIEDLFINRSTYDNEVKAFSFLAIDEGILYWKLSSATTDWSQGVSFLSSEYILAMNRINKNILINADIASSTATVNQINFDGNLAALSDGDMLYDMWQKDGLEIYQVIFPGSFKIGTKYTKTRRVYENGVLIESTRELITSPSASSSIWKIKFKYDNYHNDQGSYIHVQMQVEEGEHATDFEVISFEDSFNKCNRNYQKLLPEQAMPIVQSDLTIRKIQIPAIVQHVSSTSHPEDIDVVITGGTITSKKCENYSIIISAIATSEDTEVILNSVKLKGQYYRLPF